MINPKALEEIKKKIPCVKDTIGYPYEICVEDCNGSGIWWTTDGLYCYCENHKEIGEKYNAVLFKNRPKLRMRNKEK